MVKSISKSSPAWAQGGNGSIKQNGGGTQVPGGSSQEGSSEGKYAKGGPGHMVGQGGANPAVAGMTTSNQGGKGALFASGGKTSMHGFTGSCAARPGNSAAS